MNIIEKKRKENAHSFLVLPNCGIGITKGRNSIIRKEGGEVSDEKSNQDTNK